MGYRTALHRHTVLPFERPCRISEVLDRGTNAICYRGMRDKEALLILELFPSHPEGGIYRDTEGQIRVKPEAEEFWQIHRAHFRNGQEVHSRYLADHPECGSSGLPEEAVCNGTLYRAIPFPEGRYLREAWKSQSSLLVHTGRILRLLDALEAYHKCGYLHLDLEPDRIFLTGHDAAEQIWLLQPNLPDPGQLRIRLGYAPPELENGFPETADFSSDLYSVAAVFFHSLMGRPLTLEELLGSGSPSVRDSVCLQKEPYPVQQMVNRILKKGLQILPAKRYRSIGQMRHAFRELEARILHSGVTHWSLWENGRRSTRDWEAQLSGPVDCLVESWRIQGKRRSAEVPALIRVDLSGLSAEDPVGVRRKILEVLHLPEGAMKALEQQMNTTLHTGDPVLLVVLDGAEDPGSEIPGELESLRRMKGLRLLDASGRKIG